MEENFNSKYHSAIKIVIIYMIISSVYIVFSDWLIQATAPDNLPNAALSRIQLFKGLVAFVLLTSAILFLLVFREIKFQRKIIFKLEEQKETLTRLSEERENTRQSLSERNVYIETILENLPIGLAVNKINEGTATYMNPKFNEIYGWPEEAITDTAEFFKKIYPDDAYREKMEKQIMADIESGIPERMHWEEIEITTNTGDKKIVNAQNIPIFNQDLMISTVEDVTSRKEAEFKTKETKNLLDKTINSLKEAVLVVDPRNRTIVMANKATCDIFGYNHEELIGKSTEKLHVNKKKFKNFAEKSEPKLKEHGLFRTNYKMKRKDGSVFYTENTVTTIYNEELWESGVVSLIRDISLRKKSEKEIKEYQKSLQNLTTEISLVEEQQRKEIAANIHDHLSQSLVISKMKLSDLKKKIELAAYQKELEAIIGHISQALENSRKITYDLSPPVLYELGLIETLYWLTGKLEEENQFQVNFTTECNSVELTDSKLIIIYRSIQEIINNTIKYAEASQLDIRLKEKIKGMEITIADNGIGFDVNELKIVNQSNTGFGLFAVKERIKNLKGTFSIVSEKGVGTEVKIYVPLKDS